MDIGLKKAIKAVGSAAALAKSLNITKGAVSRWDVIPRKRLSKIAAITGLPITELHPDFRTTITKEAS